MRPPLPAKILRLECTAYLAGAEPGVTVAPCNRGPAAVMQVAAPVSPLEAGGSRPAVAVAAARGTARLPTGTVTFLFTDIEGSTSAWIKNPTAMRTALARHD